MGRQGVNIVAETLARGIDCESIDPARGAR